MNESITQHPLESFRQELYRQVLGRRRDALFELLEAALVAAGPTTLVRHSCVPLFHRKWSSACDALADGTLSEEQARALLAGAHTVGSAGGRELWALDGTGWPRPAARTSPARTWVHRVTPGIPQSGIVPGWEYQWLVAVPEAQGSWVIPLDLRRRPPTGPAPTTLALAQLRDALRQRPPAAPRPLVTCDSTYDAVALAQATRATEPALRVDVDILVRLSPRHRYYLPPPPYAGKGRPRKHGAVLKLWDPATLPPPDRSAAASEVAHGRVRVDVWIGVHAQKAPDIPLTLVRVQVERLPKSGRTPEPLWLAWIGDALPADLVDLWRWYTRRFSVEHGFRFLKQELGWTRVHPRAPEAADRWSWLLALALAELWLARDWVVGECLPWERPQEPPRQSPGRVRRALGAFLAALRSPVASVRARGKSPGRCPGQCPGPAPRQPVLARRRKRAKRRRKRARTHPVTHAA